MRTCNWMFTTCLLASLSAAAQQPADSQPSSPAAPPAAVQTAQPESSGQVSQPAPSPQAEQAPAPAASPLPQPTTMDQVVDRFIEREHGLIKTLASRTPGAETTTFSGAWIWASPWTARTT